MIGRTDRKTSFRKGLLRTASFALLASLVAVSAWAEDTASSTALPLKITCKRSVGDQMRYRAIAAVSGGMTIPGAVQPTPLDLKIEMVVKYAVVKPTAPETTEILISTESANILVGENRMQAPASPQSVVRLDRTGKITSITGADRIMGLFGANISSLMTLILPVFPADGIEVGQEWTTEAPIEGLNRQLTVKNTLLGVERVDEGETAKVKQVFELAPIQGTVDAPQAAGVTARGESTSHFAITDGSLTKAQAEITLTSDGAGGGTTAPSVDARVKLDVNVLPK